MSLSNLQNVLNQYLGENRLFKTLEPFYVIITLLYPALELLTHISIFHGLSNLVFCVSGILYFLSIVGLIISFAKNNMLIVMVFFALLAMEQIYYIFSGILQEYIGSRIIINYIIHLVIYAYLAYIAMVRYNKTSKSE